MRLLALLAGLAFLFSTAGYLEVAQAAEGKKVQQKKKEKVQQGPGNVKKEPKK
jgi:hypothetical protein